MVKLGILGASGRMGQQVLNLAQSEFSSKFELVARASQDEDLTPLLKSDLIIDFSLPDALHSFLELAESQNKFPVLVSGTTGYGDDVKKLLKTYSAKTSVMTAFNYSIGINVILQCLRQASAVLKSSGFEVKILDRHHIHKKDIPSGTAISLREAVGDSSIPVESLREGEVIGDHEVSFVNSVESLTFSHRAVDRAIFAKGALQAALWLYQEHLIKPRGWLAMEDYMKGLKAGQ